MGSRITRFLTEEKSSTKVSFDLFPDFKPFLDPVDFSDCKRYDFYLNRVLLTEKECGEYVTSHNKEMCKFQTNGLTFNS